MFRPRKNRRKVDLAKRTDEVKASVKSHGPAIVKALLATALSAGALFGGFKAWTWATTSDTFALRRVVVSGNTHATDAQVMKLGGLSLGLNVVALDISGVERALSTHPWVKSVELRRRFPDTVSVQVIEREPVALLALADLYLVDADGEPFKRAQPSEIVDLPLVTGVDREALVSRPDETKAVVRRAVAALSAYASSPASAGRAASEVHVSDFGLTLVSSAGEEIVFGEVDVEAALARLVRVRKELSARNMSAEVIRLDNRARPDWVAVQPSKRNGRAP